jgi:hypothetical protein
VRCVIASKISPGQLVIRSKKKIARPAAIRQTRTKASGHENRLRIKKYSPPYPLDTKGCCSPQNNPKKSLVIVAQCAVHFKSILPVGLLAEIPSIRTANEVAVTPRYGLEIIAFGFFARLVLPRNRTRPQNRKNVLIRLVFRPFARNDQHSSTRTAVKRTGQVRWK